jgi:hypothetical protein
LSPLPEPRAIREYRDVDPATFEDIRARGQPAILRDLAARWPAVEAAKASAEELIAYVRRFRTGSPVRAIVGAPDIEGRFFYGDALTALNFGQGTTMLDPFLDRLLRDRDNPRPYALAVQSTPIPEVLPGFERDNKVDVLPPEVVPRMWMGNAARVAAHYDLMENIGCVVGGRRRFILFPPDQVSNLYVGPFELTPAGTPVSMVDLKEPDLERYPRFADAMATAQSAELGPGDAIYIPFHWWHAVESVEPINLFVNYWWNPASANPSGAYDAMLHALIALRTLPADQRAAWREMFDTFVFCTHGDPTEHLPPEVRGFMDPSSPQQLQRMRASLKQALQRL